MITLSTLDGKRPYHHGDLREVLLAGTLAILEEGGDPAALSLREAARRAGVSAMAPYRHFADKDALLTAVATIGFERLTLALHAADEESMAPRAALDAQGVAYVRFACAHPALFRLMFGAGGPDKKGELAETAGRTYRVLAQRVASVAAPSVSADAALAAWALVHGLAMLAVDGQLDHFEARPECLAERIVKLAFGGISQNGIEDPSQA